MRSTPPIQGLWNLQLLGRVRLSGTEGQVRLPRLTAAVLAYLALEGSTPKYRLAGWLWPDSTEEAAKANMRKLLQRLRANAASDLIVGDERIELSPLVEVDAVQLSGFSFAGEHAAVAASEGELLEGLEFDDCPEFDEWLQATRESFRSLRRDAAVAEAEQLESGGQYGEALGFARRVIELDPVSEEAHRRVMRLLYLLGDRGAALAAYERCREILNREFGAKPLPETLELAHQIERGEAIGGAKPSSGIKPIGAKPLEKPSLQTSTARPSVLVGREREWALMEEAYREGKLVFLRGEPGVGKTRLAMEFAATKGPVSLISPRPGDSKVPFATYARAVREAYLRRPELIATLPAWVKRELSRLVPEMAEDSPPPLASEAEKLRFFDALGELNRLGNSGYIVVGDDAQYMDSATVEALGYLLSKFGRVGQGSSLEFTIEIYRRGELDPQVEQNVVYGLVEAGLAVLIDVEPLPQEAVGQLLERLELAGTEGMAHQLTRFTGGNPLFVLETVRHLQETGQLQRGWPGRLPPPGKVGTVINQRLGKLSAQALGMARAAAILECDFNLNLMGQVLKTDPLDLLEPWQELEAAQIFQGNGFSHDLLYETVLAGIPSAIGTLLHQRVAEVLSETKADPARIAEHWEAGGEPAKAAPRWLEAAQQADHTYCVIEAVGFLEQSAQAFERVGESEQAFQARLGAVEALWRHDSGPRQGNLIEQLLATAHTLQQKGEAWSARAWWLLTRDRYSEAEAAAQEGLATLGEPQTHPTTAGKLLRALADALNNQNRHAEALLALEQSNRLLEAIQDDVGLFFNALNYGNILLQTHRFQESVAHHQKLLQDLKVDFTAIAQAEIHHRLSYSWFYLAQFEAALQAAQRAEALLQDSDGVDHTLYQVWIDMGRARLGLERYGEALSDFRRAESLLKPHESRSAIIEAYGALYRMLGAWETRQSELERLLHEAEATAFADGLRQLHQVSYLRAMGQVEPAKALLDELKPKLEAAGHGHIWARLQLEHTLYAPEPNWISVQEVLEWLEQREFPGLKTKALAYAARVLVRLGRVEEALEHSRAALGRLPQYPPTGGRALLWLSRYQALKAAGQAGALQALQQALDWITQVAQNHVPEEFRQGYLTRNPVNREVLEAARLEGLEPSA